MIEKQKYELDPYSCLAPPSPTFYSPFQNPTKLNISSQESTESPIKLGDTLKKVPNDFQDSQDPYSQLSIREKPKT